MEIKEKKGIQLNQAFGAVLTVVLIAVLVIVAIYLFVILDTSLDATGTSGAYVNESITPTTAGVNLAANSLRDGSCGTITTVYNATGTPITSGNYTQTGCLLANRTATFQVGAWSVSYPYTWSATTAASNASTVTITNFSGFPALLGLIGTIIFLGIVIGVLVASFVFGKKEV